MSVQAVFFDIDGTLVTDQAKSLDTTRYAIKALQAQGILCGIATGRSPYRLDQQIDSLKLDVYVTYNGQYVYTGAGEVLYQQPFDKNTVLQIAKFADENKRQLLFGTEEALIGSRLMMVGQHPLAKRIQSVLPKGSGVNYFKQAIQALPKKQKKARYQELVNTPERIYQCTMISPEKETKELERIFPQCSFTRSNPFTVDMIPKGGSKLIGIEQVVNQVSIPLNQVMAFGDSGNDVEMIQSVGYGVVMGNGTTEAKQVADYVTKGHDEDGIYEALCHYQLISPYKVK